MILYVFDEDFPLPQPATTHRSGTIVDHFIVHRNDSIRDIVEMIRTHARTERNIWLLRLCGHGYTGSIQLGKGLNRTNACQFIGVSDYFTPNGRGIELHGCLVASARLPSAQCRQEYLNEIHNGQPISQTCEYGARPQLNFNRWTMRPRHSASNGLGYAFMQELADAALVPVTAAYDLQYADPEFRWEGRGTMTAQPRNRNMSCVGEAAMET